MWYQQKDILLTFLINKLAYILCLKYDIVYLHSKVEENADSLFKYLFLDGTELVLDCLLNVLFYTLILSFVE